MSGIFYNENSRAAFAALGAVMDDGVIPQGTIDARSISDLTGDDLADCHQAHFFAGAGAWALAAKLAGWPDHWPLWTGSCPCQPFSQAGRRAGVDDERHLWPDFFSLIRAARPPIIVGEQVAGKAGLAWFDGVAADLGSAGYACRVVDIPAAAVDAPNIRQRLYWVAVANSEQPGEGRRQLSRPGEGGEEAGIRAPDQSSGRNGDRGQLADAAGEGPFPSPQGGIHRQAQGEWPRDEQSERHHGAGERMGDAIEPRLEGQRRDGDGTRGRAVDAGSTAEADGGDVGDAGGQPSERDAGGLLGEETASSSARVEDGSGSLGRSYADGRNGSFWSDSEWLICHDGKARRTQPGLRLLADGVAGRVHQWHIAGNGINIPLAVEVLAALKEMLIEEWGWKP